MQRAVRAHLNITDFDSLGSVDDVSTKSESARSSVNIITCNYYIKMFDGRMENSSESVFETQLVYGFKAYWSDENGETSNLMSLFPRISWAQYLRPRKTDSYDIVNMLFENGDGRREGSILISGQDQIYYHKADKVSVFPDTDIYEDWRLDVLVPGAYQTRKFLPYDATYWTKVDTLLHSNGRSSLLRKFEAHFGNCADTGAFRQSWYS